MRRAPVRVRAAVGATVVVAPALVATGLAVVLTLRSGLADTARLEAESVAREAAAQATDVRDGGLSGIEALEGDAPVQVVDARGRVRGTTEGLRGRLADFYRVGMRPPAPGPTGDAREPDDAAGGDDRSGPAATGDATGGDGDQDDDGEGPGGDSGDSGDSGDDRDDGDDGDEGGDRDDDSGGEQGAHDPGDGTPARPDPRIGAEDDGDAPVSAAPSPEPVRVDRDSRDGVVTLPVDEDGEPAAQAAARQDFSVVGVHAVTRDGTPVTVYAGTSLAGQQEAVASVSRAMLLGLPAVLAVAGGVTWLVTRRALQPVEGIRQGMADITASRDLSRRVPEPGARDEVARLARTTNETLAALEEAVERQRRFVADASHELRSPIASLRTQLEVGAAHPELLDVGGAVEDTVRLQELAADLLLLARLDAGEGPGEARVELAELVREELAQRPARVPVRTELAASGVTGSRPQLARVVGNLLDNAQRHAGSAVRVSLRDGVLEVADDGAGVPEAERDRVFERFVRLDDARSRDDGGAGLGLAIARDVVERHGGTLTVGTSPEGGALFTVRLPAA